MRKSLHQSCWAELTSMNFATLWPLSLQPLWKQFDVSDDFHSKDHPVDHAHHWYELFFEPNKDIWIGNLREEQECLPEIIPRRWPIFLTSFLELNTNVECKYQYWTTRTKKRMYYTCLDKENKMKKLNTLFLCTQQPKMSCGENRTW